LLVLRLGLNLFLSLLPQQATRTADDFLLHQACLDAVI